MRLRLMAIGRDFFGDDALAEDVAQETLMRLWAVRQKVDMDRGVEALAVKMAKNICVSVWRKRKARREIGMAASVEPDGHTPQPMADTDNERMLRQALERLTGAERRLFCMRHELGMDISQIAAATGVAPRSVSAMLSVARKKIYEHLTKISGGQCL